MTGIRKSLRALPAFMGAAAAAGCSTVNLQSALVAGGTGTTVHAEGPVETYSRIARGALGCWFRSDGSFKKSHIFHADVESNATAAEIVIHERDPSAPSPRSLRAMRITITPSGQGSQVTVENLKFPEPVGREMMEEIARWADDQPSCKSPGGPSVAAASPAATVTTAAPVATPTPPAGATPPSPAAGAPPTGAPPAAAKAARK